jgi:dual specificity phosphatase 12
VTRRADIPKYHIFEPEFSEQLVLRQIDIDDDPLGDILCHLKDACDWMQSVLRPSPLEHGNDLATQLGVLVHCIQGMSRSERLLLHIVSHSPFIST